MVTPPPTQPIASLPDLRELSTLELFSSDLKQVAEGENEEQAYEYAELIRDLLERQPEVERDFAVLFQQYEGVRAQFRWLALSHYEPVEIIGLFGHHFVESYEVPYLNVWSKLRTKLLSLASVENRNALKQQVLAALRENDQQLTKETVTKDGLEKHGSVQNWLMDSLVALGSQPIETIALSEYLVNSPNTKSLSEESRRRVSQLLELVEKLKRPSDTPEGYEGEIPVDDPERLGIIVDGEYQKRRTEYDTAREQLAAVRRVLSETPTTAVAPSAVTPAPRPAQSPVVGSSTSPHQPMSALSIDQSAVFTEEQRLLKKMAKDQLMALPELTSAIREKNIVSVVALLIVLAKTQELLQVIVMDSEFRAWLIQSHGPEADQQFSQQPTDPIFFSLWLQYVLRERLGQADADSAHLAAQLANLLGRRYLRAAYLDQPTGQYTWAGIVKEQRRLKFAEEK